MRIGVCSRDDLQTFYPSSSDGKDVLDDPNLTQPDIELSFMNWLNSLSLVLLMKSSTYGLGLSLDM